MPARGIRQALVVNEEGAKFRLADNETTVQDRVTQVDQPQRVRAATWKRRADAEHEAHIEGQSEQRGTQSQICWDMPAKTSRFRSQEGMTGWSR